MLLDQKRTKRMVQVVAIFTSIAFGGVIFLVLGLILLGGGTSTQGGEDLGPLRAAVEQNPQDAEAWSDLAFAQVSNGDIEDALGSAERARALDPAEIEHLQLVIDIRDRAGQRAKALSDARDFTADNPRNPEGFLLLGQLAVEQNQLDLARLAYQTFLRLAPDDANADEVRTALEQLGTGGGGGGGGSGG